MVHLFKRCRYCCMIMVCCLFPGCMGDAVEFSEKAGNETPADLLVRIVPQEHVDSALVFFFRKMGGKDSLISRETVYDIAYFEPHSFLFQLPAGQYSMVVFGNVRTEYLVVHPPYSSQDVYFDYNHGRRPSEIYFGRRSIEVGKDTSVVSGMLALSSFVQLTIHEVPVGISQIIARILNTSAGFNMAAGYLNETTNPPLADTLYELRSDSSYLVDFYCFPGIRPNDRSTIVVECYDQNGRMVYSGKSEPFQARPGYNFAIGCSFAAISLTTKGKDFSLGEVYFEIKRL